VRLPPRSRFAVADNRVDNMELISSLLPSSLIGNLISLMSSSFGILKMLQSYLSPLFSRIATQPDLASIAVLVVVLFVSFKILGMAYRAVMFWVTLVFQLALWGGMAVLGLWVYNRGVDGFFEDVKGLMEHWGGELERYGGEYQRAKGMKEQQMRFAQKQGERKRNGWR
jgi:hypothetical protein